MPTLRDRIHDQALADTLTEALAAVQYDATPSGLAAVAIACVDGHLSALAPRRNFTPAHLGLVYILAEDQGATHVRLRRIWDAKSSRPRSPWPWISDSGIRTRCSELVAWGLVEDIGARGTSATGRPSTIWTLTGVHPAKVGRDVEQVPGLDPGVHERLHELLNEAGSDGVIRSQLELAAEVAGFGVTSIDITPDLSGLRA
jgi:hypothetical protein